MQNDYGEGKGRAHHRTTLGWIRPVLFIHGTKKEEITYL